MLIYGRDKALTQWAGERLGIKDFGPCTTIGVAHDNKIVAAAVYNNYRHPNIEITFVTSSPQWASPGAIRAILQYPFLQLGCKRITALARTNNLKALTFLVRLGFQHEGVHPDIFADGDGVSYGLLKKQAARWIDV